MTRWQFTTLPTQPRRANVVLAVFGRGPLHEIEPDPTAFGAPTIELARTYDVRSIARALDPAWFDNWRGGSLRTIAERDLAPAELAALDGADHVHMIIGEFADPTDLGYLQAAWALARYLVARGGEVVLDAHAMRYAATLPAPDLALDVGREIQIIFETDSARSDRAHALHTRGMLKFGMPDLVALCSDADADLVVQVVAQLAASIARGADVAMPRHGVDILDGMTWYLVDDEHGIAGLLQLNNTARVLVDDTGKNLVGVAARLPIVS